MKKTETFELNNYYIGQKPYNHRYIEKEKDRERLYPSILESKSKQASYKSTSSGSGLGTQNKLSIYQSDDSYFPTFADGNSTKKRPTQSSNDYIALSKDGSHFNHLTLRNSIENKDPNIHDSLTPTKLKYYKTLNDLKGDKGTTDSSNNPYSKQNFKGKNKLMKSFNIREVF